MHVLYSNSRIFVIPVYIFNGRKQTLVDTSGYCQRCACMVCMTSASSWPNCVSRVARIVNNAGMRTKFGVWGDSDNFKLFACLLNLPYPHSGKPCMGIAMGISLVLLVCSLCTTDLLIMNVSLWVSCRFPTSSTSTTESYRLMKTWQSRLWQFPWFPHLLFKRGGERKRICISAVEVGFLRVRMRASIPL